MARKVFFSFHYDRDSTRINQIRNSGVVGNYDKPPFYDKAEWEAIKRRGKAAIQSWIDEQLKGASVTIVLIGLETASRPWVKYEIEKSIRDGKGLLGIDMAGMKNLAGQVDGPGRNPLPSSYSVHNWILDNGRMNLATWIEDAARRAGR